MKEFVEINGYGKLFVDKVIFESYFPIIFTCTNEKNDLFLCICCQNNEKGCKWLVGKTNSDLIISMLKDEITVRELLLNHSEGRITVDYINGEYKIFFNNSDWESESIFLPKKGSYLDVEDGEFEDEILYFSSFNKVDYDEKIYKNLSSVVRNFINEIDPISEVLFEYVNVKGIKTIPSEVIRIKEVSGELYKDVYIEKEIYSSAESFKQIYKRIYDNSDEIVELSIEATNNTFVNAA